MCRTADDDHVSTLGFPGIRFGDSKNANIWSDPFGDRTRDRACVSEHRLVNDHRTHLDAFSSAPKVQAKGPHRMT